MTDPWLARYSIDVDFRDFSPAGDGVTDDTPKLRLALAQGVAALGVNGGRMRLLFDSKHYLLSSPPVYGGPGGSYAQVGLPVAPTTGPRNIIEFVGCPTGPWSETEAQLAKQSPGTILHGSLTGQVHDAVKGIPSMIGGPAILGAGTGWSNLEFIARDITFRLPDDPSYVAVDTFNAMQAYFVDCMFDVDARISAISPPTHITGIGLVMPGVNNNGIARLAGVTSFRGFYGTVLANEHLSADYLATYKCKTALAISTTMIHASHISIFKSEWCNYGICSLDVGAGPVALPRSFLQVGLWDIEDGPAGPWAPVTHILDPDDQLRMRGTYLRVLEGGIPTTGITGAGSRTVLTDLGA